MCSIFLILFVGGLDFYFGFIYHPNLYYQSVIMSFRFDERFSIFPVGDK